MPTIECMHERMQPAHDYCPDCGETQTAESRAIRTLRARAERAEANAANWEEQANDRVSDWDEVRAERDALRADAERFAWYFGSEDKMPFMKAYIDGLASGYTLDQWRAAIDAAMERADET